MFKCHADQINYLFTYSAEEIFEQRNKFTFIAV